MKDLKIRVTTQAESKEAQELFFKLGYKWISGGKNIQHLEQSCSSGFGYLVAWSTGCFANVIQCGCGAEDAKEITLQELRDMVNQDQDEPFLTPETTLNDQYAEIEQVRQSAYDKQEGGSHYKKLAIQPMQYALANKLDYAQANVVKYVTRHADKNGKEDLLKAIHNIELMIEHYYGVEK